MALTALIFDVDGTLAETEEVHRQAFNAAFAEAELPWVWGKEEYRRLLKVTGGKERIKHYLDVSKRPRLDDTEIARLHAAKTAIYTAAVDAGQVPLRPGVIKLITEAKVAGLRLGVATTTSRANVDALVEAAFPLRREPWFDAMICGENVVRKKPDPEVYDQCVEVLGVRPHQALAIEDTHVGLKAATRAGLRCVVTPSMYSLGEDFASALLVADNLTQVRLTDLGRLMAAST